MTAFQRVLCVVLVLARVPAVVNGFECIVCTPPRVVHPDKTQVHICTELAEADADAFNIATSCFE
jgi:hypothetical protein